MKEHRRTKSQHHGRNVLRIKVVPKMMYEKISNTADDVKTRAEREMNMTTDLLAEAGIKEPKIFNIKLGALLKSYLIICIVTTSY